MAGKLPEEWVDPDPSDPAGWRLEAGLDRQLAVYGEARGTGGAFC